jgi:hypothetical protein
MLAVIGTILVLCWILGLTLRIAGGFIHAILVIALVLFLVHFLR